MNIELTQDNDIVAISITGTLDSSTITDLNDHSQEWLRKKANKFIIDLSKLDFISSSGLRVFVLFAKELNRRGGEMVFSRMNERVHKIFELGGLFDHVFHTFATLEEATAYLQQKP